MRAFQQGQAVPGFDQQVHIAAPGLVIRARAKEIHLGSVAGEILRGREDGLYLAGGQAHRTDGIRQAAPQALGQNQHATMVISCIDGTAAQPVQRACAAVMPTKRVLSASPA